MKRRIALSLGALIVTTAALSGCSSDDAQPEATPTPSVSVTPINTLPLEEWVKTEEFRDEFKPAGNAPKWCSGVGEASKAYYLSGVPTATPSDKNPYDVFVSQVIASLKSGKPDGYQEMVKDIEKLSAYLKKREIEKETGYMDPYYIKLSERIPRYFQQQCGNDFVSDGSPAVR